MPPRSPRPVCSSGKSRTKARPARGSRRSRSPRRCVPDSPGTRPAGLTATASVGFASATFEQIDLAGAQRQRLVRRRLWRCARPLRRAVRASPRTPASSTPARALGWWPEDRATRLRPTARTSASCPGSARRHPQAGLPRRPPDGPHHGRGRWLDGRTIRSAALDPSGAPRQQRVQDLHDRATGTNKKPTAEATRMDATVSIVPVFGAPASLALVGLGGRWSRAVVAAKSCKRLLVGVACGNKSPSARPLAEEVQRPEARTVASTRISHHDAGVSLRSDAISWRSAD